jgi:cell division protein FtsQ
MKNMFKKLQIKSWVIYSCLGAVLLMLIGFVANKQGEKRVKNVSIEIDHSGNNYFVEENDVIDLMTLNGSDPIVDKKYRYLNLKEVEMRIKFFKFVSDAQVSKDHKGNVKVLVKQKRPIARVIYPNGVHAYIGSDGTTLSTSEKFTSRVVIVDGEYASQLMSEDFLKTEEGHGYFDLLKLVDEDKFWKAQLAQISIDRSGEVVLYPQLGRQTIYLGKPEDLEVKFRNLGLFYTKIVPVKGWNAYKTVNLKYKNQLICE